MCAQRTESNHSAVVRLPSTTYCPAAPTCVDEPSNGLPLTYWRDAISDAGRSIATSSSSVPVGAGADSLTEIRYEIRIKHCSAFLIGTFDQFKDCVFDIMPD